NAAEQQLPFDRAERVDTEVRGRRDARPGGRRRQRIGNVGGGHDELTHAVRVRIDDRYAALVDTSREAERDDRRRDTTRGVGQPRQRTAREDRQAASCSRESSSSAIRYQSDGSEARSARISLSEIGNPHSAAWPSVCRGLRRKESRNSSSSMSSPIKISSPCSR